MSFSHALVLLALSGVLPAVAAHGSLRKRAPVNSLNVSVDATSLHANGWVEPPRIDGRVPNSKELTCLLKHEVAIEWAPESQLQPGSRLKSQWSSCAVVSNSGILAKEKHGKAIDEASLVMRFNDAPLKGFEEQVGHRDDFRFVNEKVARQALKTAAGGSYPMKSRSLGPFGVKVNTNTTFVVIPITPPPSLQSLRSLYPDIEWNMLAKDPLKDITKVLRKIYAMALNGFHQEWFTHWTPTSGAVGMIIALSMCDHVKAYGMTAGREDWISPYHYYEKGGNADVNTIHKMFNVEKDLWRRLAQNSQKQIDDEGVADILGYSLAGCEEAS